MLPTPSPVAYAGFLKGGAGNLKIMKTKATTQNLFGFWSKIRKFGEDKKKRKRSLLKFSPVFGPKLGENQKKKENKGLHPDSVPFMGSNFLPKLHGGHAAILHTILC